MSSGKNVVHIVVTDANILINLIHVRHIGILGRLPGYEFVVPNEVIREVTNPQQHEILQATIDSGELRSMAIDDIATLELFVELCSIMGPGEAACLSIAVLRGWLIASDEKRVFRRESEARLGPGRIINTAGIFLMAIRAGILTIEEADEARSWLENHRFRLPFKSFSEIL